MEFWNNEEGENKTPTKSMEISLDVAYMLSEEVVAREIEGELIVVPIVSGIGNMEDELFNINESGRAILNLLDGKMSLKDVVDELRVRFEASAKAIEEDVVGFTEELLRRGIIVEATGK